MGVIRGDTTMQRVGTIAVRVPPAGLEDLDTGMSAVIGADGPGQPSLFTLHRLNPCALAFAAGMRPIMPHLTQKPGEEHQGSQKAANATANPTVHGESVIRASLACPRRSTPAAYLPTSSGGRM